MRYFIILNPFIILNYFIILNPFKNGIAGPRKISHQYI